MSYTSAVDVASAVKIATEQLKSDDRIDDDDEQYQQRDMQQWNHRFENGIEHHLQACAPHTNKCIILNTVHVMSG